MHKICFNDNSGGREKGGCQKNVHINFSCSHFPTTLLTHLGLEERLQDSDLKRGTLTASTGLDVKLLFSTSTLHLLSSFTSLQSTSLQVTTSIASSLSVSEKP